MRTQALMRAEIAGAALTADRSTSHPKELWAGRELRVLFGRLVISPLFLLLSLFVLYFVPHILLNARTRSYVLRSIANSLHTALSSIIALMALLLCSPVLLLVAIFMMLESKGAIFSSRQVVGKNRRKVQNRIRLQVLGQSCTHERRIHDLQGRLFTLYEFSALSDGRGRPKRPPLNNRKTSRASMRRLLLHARAARILELINVAKGEMSLVGPRPQDPHIPGRWGTQIRGYSARFRVKPGIVGLAQMRGYMPTSLKAARAELRYDSLYCRKRCLGLDARIIAVSALDALRTMVAYRHRELTEN